MVTLFLLLFSSRFLSRPKDGEEEKKKREFAIQWTGNYSLGYSYLSILSLNIFLSRLFRPSLSSHPRKEKKFNS